MAASKIGKEITKDKLRTLQRPLFTLPNYRCFLCQKGQLSSRRFATSPRLGKDGSSYSNGSRLRTALRKTKIEWKPIPIGLGIGFLGAIQFYRVREREKRRQEEYENTTSEVGEQNGGRPKKRKKIRPSGPWYVDSFERGYVLNHY